MKTDIHTDNAPSAIGTYSQAIRCDKTVYLSGQIPLDPITMELVSDNVVEQAHQMFKNLSAVCEASGGSLDCIVKLNIYLTDLSCFMDINEVMGHYFQRPYPARAAIGVSDLPKKSKIEADGIMVL